VDVYESPGIPGVEVNGIRISPYDPFYRTSDPYRFSEDNFPISCGDSAELRVTYPKFDGIAGTLHARIMLPAQFEITSPGTPDTIALGDSLVFHWTSSAGADAYIADFRLTYYYVDTVGDNQFFEYYAYDTVLTDTSLTFSQAQLFPHLEDIDSLVYGYGNFDLSAMNGPTPDEDQGNVTGDGIGFFSGLTYGGFVNVRISASGTMTCEAQEPDNPAWRFSEQRIRPLNL
jgi:hypothetical protein